MSESTKKQVYTIPDDMRAALSAPLPPEAIKEGAYGKGLSSISPAHVAERLNDVFGCGGWVFEYDPKDIRYFSKDETGKSAGDNAVSHVVVHGTLRVYGPSFGGREMTDLIFPASGGSTNTDIGDMVKGAISDATGKAAATYLGVGAYVYKGELDTKRAPSAPRAPQTPRQAPQSQPIQSEGVPTLCPVCAEAGNMNPMNLVPAGVSGKTGKPYNAFYSCPTCKHTMRP